MPQSNTILEDDFVRSCADISSPEEYRLFLQALNKKCNQNDKSLVSESLFDTLDPEDTLGQAKLLLCLVAQDTNILLSETLLNKLLAQSDDEYLMVVCALYLITKKSEDEKYFREWLLAPDAYTPPKLSEDTTYYIITLMGCSGNIQFVSLLYEILTKHYHFIGQDGVVRALIHLDAQPDKDEIPYSRSITVIEANSDIILYTDDKYTGSSNCPSCTFFPCHINNYFKSGIQDCNLWNKIDPATLENIEDKRDWGEYLIPEKVIDDQQDSTWIRARKLMVEKSYCHAIPLLCSTLLDTEQLTSTFKSSMIPLAWIYLSQCFSAYDEKELAFIAIREASNYKKLIPETKVDEKKLLDVFDNNPESILGENNNRPYDLLAAVNFKRHHQWVKACDCYTHDNICNHGNDAGDWFQMGECHRELKEYRLAELFMRKGATISRERYLRDRFVKGADEVHDLLSREEDIGLSLDLRRNERASTPPT